MKKLPDQLLRFVNKNRLFEPGDSLLIAVSGGLDSTVLVHILHSLKFQISLAHCNFQLRGDDSDGDSDFVKAFGAKNGITHHVKKFDTQSFASSNQLSTQVAARELRYKWFEELINQHDYKYLITAHHANDQVETVLYNLTKGTGIAGLRGIPLKNNRIRRPLLFAQREEIEAYAKFHQLQWREDASNQEDKYSRNRIRLNVLPELKQINPGLEHTFDNNTRRFGAIEKLISHQVSEIRTKYLTSTKNRISLSMDWYDQAEGGNAVLMELLKAFGFNSDQCFAIGENCSADDSNSVGNTYYSSDFILAIDRGKLELTQINSIPNIHIKVEKNDQSISTLTSDFKIDLIENNGAWSADKNTANLDAEKIQFPITLRNWKEGDSFQPLGMKGKKKLSDFMIDEKIPVNLKSRVVLFESENNIIWVAGYRIDDRYKITSKTKQVLIIKMTDHV